MKIKDRLQQIFGGGMTMDSDTSAEPMAAEMPITGGDELPMEEMIPEKSAIGAEEIARAMQTLAKYKAGKTNLEARIIEDQEWYRMRHWKQLRKDDKEKEGDEKVKGEEKGDKRTSKKRSRKRKKL